jgi:RNA polymerase sigma-70 factor (ECF subfamily)
MIAAAEQRAESRSIAQPSLTADDLLDARPQLIAYAYHLTRNRADAEDLVQEACCRAWAARDRFIPGEVPPIGWLRRIAKNLFLNGVTSKRARTAHVDIDDVAVAPHLPPALPDAFDAITQAEINEFIATLGLHDRVLALALMRGMKLPEIAAHFGCSTTAMGARLYRMRARLRAEAGSLEPA